MRRLCFATLVCFVVLSAVSIASAQSPVYLGSNGCPDMCRGNPPVQHPRIVQTSGSGAVFNIRWTHWGAAKTTGWGTFKSLSGGQAPLKLVASRIVICGGRRVYSHLVTSAYQVLHLDKNGCVLTP